jgi:MinD-like ATPase involved in chromosome partitioning or flagellar assembly
MSKKVLVYVSKGGVGKSLTAREIVAGPMAKSTVIVEIDPLNKTQMNYKEHFKEVVVLNNSNAQKALNYLIKEDNVVIDIGADSLSDGMASIKNYSLLDYIDVVVIPIIPGRSEAQNALLIYSRLTEAGCENIKFVFNRRDPEKPLEEQYFVFFQNFEHKLGRSIREDEYAVVEEIEEFDFAQTHRSIVANLATSESYIEAALEADKAGNTAEFERLMDLELERRAMNRVYNEIVLPAHNKLLG